MARTCFVISPIGEEETKIRQLADDLLELIIIPALEPFNYEVVRADKIVSSGVITSEIVEHVQSADLCIIDLTGHNANVYYECGRRHETAKPFLQVIRKNEQLPFDVSGIRTLFYDLTDARAVRTTVEEMRKYVEAVSASTGSVPRSVASVTSLAESVDRLERKVDQLMARTPAGLRQKPVTAGEATAVSGFSSRRKSPYAEFMVAVARGDLAGAEAALERQIELRGTKDPTTQGMVLLLAEDAGSQRAAAVLFEDFDRLLDSFDPATSLIVGDESSESADKGPDLIRTMGALRSYYLRIDNAEEGYSRLLRPVEKTLERLGTEQGGRVARLCNMLEMLAFAAEKYNEAVEWGERAAAADPSEVSYLTNLAMSYEATNRIGEAKELIDSALQLDPNDGHTLGEAIDIYHALKDEDRVSEFMNRLQQIDQETYLLKQMLLQG